MNAVKKFARLLIVPIVAAIVFYIKKLLAFGAVATVLTLLHLAIGKDSATTNRPRTMKPQRQVAQGAPVKSNPAEKLAGPVAPAPSGAAITPSAPLGAGPIQAARNAAAAQNAQLAKETGQVVPPPKGSAPTPPPAAAPAQNQSAPAQGTQIVQQGAPKSATTAASSKADSPVMRESFDYTRDTRRDPFVSLMTTSDLRPTLTDLRLTGILYDLSGRRPVAILRDIAGGQWRVTTGMTLGRMRVAQIKPKTIIFTIEEFGFNRQDSLILGDTTRVRHR
jgi:hypothetical protein